MICCAQGAIARELAQAEAAGHLRPVSCLGSGRDPRPEGATFDGSCG